MKKILLFLSSLLVNQVILGQCSLVCPSDINTFSLNGLCGAPVTYALPAFTGTCGRQLIKNVITNGSFEDNYTGWHLSSSVGINGTFSILSTGQTISYGGQLFDYLDNQYEPQISAGLPYTGKPTDGDKVAILLENQPTTLRMYQDITLPNTENLFLSFDLQYANHAGIFDSALQFFSVVLREPSTDSIIGTLYKTKSGDPLFMPMTTKAVSVAAYAGKSVRLEMVYASINLYHFDILLDNIVLFTGIELTQTAGLSSGSIFPIGSTLNEFNVKDSNGNVSTCSFTVSVSDTQKPVITVPPDIYVNNDVKKCGAQVIYDLPRVINNCAQSAIRNVIINGGFEDNYTGWHLSNDPFAGNATFGILTKGQMITLGGLLFDYAEGKDKAQTSPGLPITGNPTEGNKEAILLETGQSIHRMYQDITLPNQKNLVLSFDLQYTSHSDGFNNNEFFSVVLRDPSTDVIIANLYKTQKGDALSMPMTTQSVGIAAYGGQKVRLDMVYAYTTRFPMDILLDNIVLSANIEVRQTAGLPSGSVFPIGTTINAFEATDLSGNTISNSFIVNVTDNEKPVITTPGDITVKNDSHQCGAIVNYRTPSFTDNCSLDSVSNVVINGGFENDYTGWHLISSVSSYGTFGILRKGQVIATGGLLFDFADNIIEAQTSPGLPYTGNPTEGNKQAILLQNGPATHRMYQDITMPTSGPLELSFDLQYSNHSGSFSSTSEFFSVVLRDPSTDTIISTLYKTQSGDPLFIPMTTKKFNVAAFAGKKVRLDMIYASINNFNLDILLDNIKLPGGPVTITQTAGLPSGSSFPIGTTANTFEVMDAWGNTATSSFVVKVTDNERPVITTPGNSKLNNDAHQCGAIVKYKTPSFTDNCNLNAIRNIVVNGSFENNYEGWHLSSSVGVSGTFGILKKGEVIAPEGTLFDFADNRNELQTSPGLPYTGNSTDGNNEAILLQNGPATHRMYQDLTLPQSGPLELSFDLQYNNHFGSFSPVSEFFSVVLRDPATDTILTTLFKTQIGDPLFLPMTTKTLSIAAYAGKSVRLDMIYASINNYNLDILLDNIRIAGDPITLRQTAGLPSGSSFPIGSTTNTFEVTDASGNTTTGSFTIKVTDNEKPDLFVPSDIIVNADKGNCYSTVDAGTAVALDNCSGVKLSSSRSDNKLINAAFQVGVTIITWKATDVSGNSRTKLQLVIVKDNEPPAIVNLSASPSQLLAPAHQMVDVNIDYQITDNCNGSVISLLSVRSNEPVSGTGNGDMAPDWKIINNHKVQLRAERSQSGIGRIYTITVTTVDLFGNITNENVDVSVPYNQNKSLVNEENKGNGLDTQPDKGLKVQVMPNPAVFNFKLMTSSSSARQLTLRVTDALGRIIETRKGLAAKGTVQLGDHYTPGIYYLEVWQGNERITLKLVKQSN